MTEHLNNLLCKLPRYNYETPRNQLPHNGVYIFYERGQTLNINNCIADRIVRIGTHKKDNRFSRRMREHYGNVNSLRGNKNGSVFRKHLGGALLRKDNPEDPRLKDWLTQDGPSFLEVEEAVSSVLRNNFTFSCFRVDQPEERLALERGLIALLTSHPLGQPSRDWLGYHAQSQEIRESGLWNTQHVNATPLTDKEFDRVKVLVNTTLQEG